MNRIIFTIVIISILLIPVVIAVELQDPTETEAFQKAEDPLKKEATNQKHS